MIEKAREEKQEELENQQMGLFDRPSIAVEEALVQVSGARTFPNPTNIWGDDDDDGPVQPSGSGAAHPVGQDDVQLVDDGTGEEVPNPSLRLDSPTTPLHLLEAPSTPTSPRGDSTIRMHENETDEEKRPKVELSKKARLSRLTEEHNSMVRVVKFAEEEYCTMDNYEDDPQLDGHMDYEDPWNAEDQLSGDSMSEALWSDVDPSVHPPAPPAWVDRLADSVELQRLCSMGVLMKEDDYKEPVHSKLTTRYGGQQDFKGPNNDQPAVKKWLRRSRCVAREYAFLERLEDTFAPASSTHVLNLLPLFGYKRLLTAKPLRAQKPTVAGFFQLWMSRTHF